MQGILVPPLVHTPLSNRASGRARAARIPRHLLHAFLMLFASVSAFAEPQETVTVHAPKPDCDKQQSDSAERLECLNATLAKTASDAHATAPDESGTPAVFGNGEPDKVGTFSRTGTAEQLGSNFGKSATPERPHAVFVPKLNPRQ